MNDQKLYHLYLQNCIDQDRTPYTFETWKRLIGPVTPANAEEFPHYFPKVPPRATHVDVYRVLAMFSVEDPCLQHAIKKALAAGRRGAKDTVKDVQEAIASLQRYLEMREEEKEIE